MKISKLVFAGATACSITIAVVCLWPQSTYSRLDQARIRATQRATFPVGIAIEQVAADMRSAVAAEGPAGVAVLLKWLEEFTRPPRFWRLRWYTAVLAKKAGIMFPLLSDFVCDQTRRDRAYVAGWVFRVPDSNTAAILPKLKEYAERSLEAQDALTALQAAKAAKP